MNIHELLGASQRTIVDALVDDLWRAVHSYDGLLNAASVVGVLECLKLEIVQDMLEVDGEEAEED